MNDTMHRCLREAVREAEDAVWETPINDHELGNTMAAKLASGADGFAKGVLWRALELMAVQLADTVKNVSGQRDAYELLAASHEREAMDLHVALTDIMRFVECDFKPGYAERPQEYKDAYASARKVLEPDRGEDDAT